METLFPYQVIGANWLAKKKVALLADEMGLGKSAQAISACDEVKSQKVLVVCPAVAKVNWLREFHKFGKQSRNFQIVHGYSTPIDPFISTIISYDSLVSGIFGLGHHYDTLIIDEVHLLKSLDAKRTKVVFGKDGIVRRAKRVWALSATPAPNDVSELWVILYTFGATKLNYFDFINHYCEVEMGNYGPKILGNKKENLEELKKILGGVMLRRKKEEVMKELPPISYSDVVVEPGEVDIELTKDFIQYAFPEDRRDVLQEQLNKDYEDVSNIIERFGERGDKTIIMLEAMAKSVSTLRRYNGLQKLAPVIELIKQELKSKAYDKLVIFAVHRDVIEGLRQGLMEFNPVTLYGGTPAEQRQRNIDRFQKVKKTKIFIGNIQAAGTAITLTAAHQVIFVEQDWVPANNAQAAMRCHRIGQTKPVFVRFIGIANSIDNQIASILRRKTKQLTELFDT
jgi:SWI/SNF-related matrix-associated actin-dependent regulator 1 of chromatin subfamily A